MPWPTSPFRLAPAQSLLPQRGCRSPLQRSISADRYWGGRVKIASDDVLFVNGVVADLGLIAHSAEGESVLKRGDAIGHPVLIRQANPPTEPSNAWTMPDDLTAATANGPGCGSTIVYDPAHWPRRGDPRSPT